MAKQSPTRESAQIKVATANINQTIINFTRNVPLIKAAIREAAEDGADVLCLQELGLTGYTGDDYFKWIKSDQQQEEIFEIVKDIADYAKAQNPNLVVSLGFPFFYRDEHQPVRDDHGLPNPLYNINKRPFNAQAFISGGQIHGLSLKSIQPDGAAEYEPRQFSSWPNYLGTKDIDIKAPDGAEDVYGSLFANKNTDGTFKVPVGNVVAQLHMSDGKAVNLYHEICADGWPGIYDDGTVNEKEIREGRYLNRIAQDHDLSLVINPSASKPEPFLDKPALRNTLASWGSKIAQGAGYIYTNCLGLEAAPAAFEGGSIFVETSDAGQPEVTHRSKRYSMMDVEYASKMMSVPSVDATKAADVTIAHQISDKRKEQSRGGADVFESKQGFEREAEEIVRNTSLWLRDYLKKTGLQGFIISLSGGADSAFGAVMVSQMIDLNLQQLEVITRGDKQEAVNRFVDQFPRLKVGEKAKDINANKGADAAIDFLKHELLTCIYLPSDNSSYVTRDAAQYLVEGGMLVDVQRGNGKTEAMFVNEKEGDVYDASNNELLKKQNDGSVETLTVLREHAPAKGIGGKFEIINVQATVDSYIEAFAGIAQKDLIGKTVVIDKDGGGTERVDLLGQMRKEIKEYVKGDRPDFSANVKTQLEAHTRFNSNRMLSWKNPGDDITLQNIQARARLPYPWMFGNQEHKIACVTSNWSEAVAGYWTFGGDGHMGAINICGGVPKSVLRNILSHLEEQGIEGADAVKVLHAINVQNPTAELRPPSADGKAEQSDEEDLMPYKQLDAIGRAIFFEKMTPLEAYRHLQMVVDPEEGQLFPGGKADVIAKIDKACSMWHRSQFKRVGSVTTPFLGQNVDPHTSIRTTILSDGFQTSLAALKLTYLYEEVAQGDDKAFEKLTDGVGLRELRLRAKIDRAVRDGINWTPVKAEGAEPTLTDKIKDIAALQETVEEIAVGGR